MSTDNDDQSALTPSQKLAALVAQRKAAAGGGRNIPGKRSAERGAAHRSASKSKPAQRKT